MAYLVIIIVLLISLNIITMRSMLQRTLTIRGEDLIASTRIIAVEASNYLESPKRLGLVARENALKYRMRVLILDNKRQLVADSQNESGLTNRSLGYPELLSALKGKSFWGVHTLPTGKTAIYASSPVISGGTIRGAIMVSAPGDDIISLYHDIRKQVLIFSLMALILASGLGFLLATRISNPVVELTRAANQVKEGYLGRQVKVKGKDELAQLAESFNAMSRQLSKVRNQRSRFFHNASHELKTPLATSILLVDNILLDLEKGKIPRYDFIADVRDQLERLQELITQLTVLARLEEREPPNYAPVDLGEILPQVYSTLAPICAQKQISFNKECDPNRQYMVWGNYHLLREAIINVVDNAVKYTPVGKSIWLKIREEDNTINIIIEDTGMGIPSEDQAHIFERFYRVDKARSREQGGSGLGLSLTREIIRAHGGDIFLTSSFKIGTRVQIRLPVLGPSDGQYQNADRVE